MFDKLFHRSGLSKYIGGILLIVGTTIGAGMLAVPVTTGMYGLLPSFVIFAFCWLFMLATAFFFLDVNFATPGDINLITMANRTLGMWGKILSWIVYLLLLYALLSAFIAGSAPIFQEEWMKLTGHQMPLAAAYFCLPVIFGSFIYLGTGGVDILNRFLMGGLLIAYILIVCVIPSHVDTNLWTRIDWNHCYYAIPIVITSFGYHIIIPTLTNYMNHDYKHLRRTLWIGAAVPLFIYLVWQGLVLGVVPGAALVEAWTAGVSATVPLSSRITSTALRYGANFFAFFAIVTSFLGVSLSLSDFLIDGLKIKKSWEGRLLALGLVFVPPLVFVFTSQRGFMLALEYAGAFVAILLGFLPAAMAWTLKKYKTAWKKAYLSLIMVISIAIFILTFAIT